MTITPMEKELAAVGISVAAGCKPCTDFHVKAARKSGASEAEIKQAMAAAFSVRRGATDVMEAYGFAQFPGSNPAFDPERVGKTDRVKELVSIGAAFAVNCASTLKAHLDAALSLGISPDEITTVAKLSAFIKGKAASHVEHLVESLEKPEVAYEKAVTTCC